MFNLGPGVQIGIAASDTGTHIAVTENSIAANGGLGIDLSPQGVVNCATAGAGPNDYTPCPIIQTASIAVVTGTACAGCTVEVFVATGEADDQGHGEGARFIGVAVADSSGRWSVSPAAGLVTKGQALTATATTPVSFQKAAETSEFAANVAAA
jgi:hypothetical protein